LFYFIYYLKLAACAKFTVNGWKERKWGSDRGGVLVKTDIVGGSHRRIFWRGRSLRLVPSLAAMRENGAGRYEKRIRMQ